MLDTPLQKQQYQVASSLFGKSPISEHSPPGYWNLFVVSIKDYNFVNYGPSHRSSSTPMANSGVNLLFTIQQFLALITHSSCSCIFIETSPALRNPETSDTAQTQCLASFPGLLLALVWRLCQFPNTIALLIFIFFSFFYNKKAFLGWVDSRVLIHSIYTRRKWSTLVVTS